MSGAWRVAVDRGGTFTDVVARSPEGRLVTFKLPSESPAYDDATVEALRRLGCPLEGLTLRLGTTVATNALLERRGARVLFVTTLGHADALLLGNQSRPELFARRILRPAPLYHAVVEAHERIAASGEVLLPLDERHLTVALEAAVPPSERPSTVIVIAFLHGAEFPAHEQRAAEIASRLAPEEVLISHDVSRLRRFVPRAETAVADGFTTPALRRFLSGVAAGLPEVAPDRVPPTLEVMRSSGLLAPAHEVRGRDVVLSGPAGGVLGVAAVRQRHGFERVVGLDMGGTSTDVCAINGGDGAPPREWERDIGGVRLVVPTLAVHTIAAGGGSVARFDGELLRVGPESAGALPGPAAAGRGGPATVTDANLVCGRLRADELPAVFGPAGDAPADVHAALASVRALADALGTDAKGAAESVLSVAVVAMARGVRRVTTERGLDVRDFALCGFGGASGQLVCRIAEALEMRTVVVPRDASVLSAMGILEAPRGSVAERVVDRPLGPDAIARARALIGPIATRGRRVEQLHVRPQRSSVSLPVPLDDDAAANFRAAFRARFGVEAPEDLVAERVSVEDLLVEGPAPPPPLAAPTSAGDRSPGIGPVRWEQLGEGERVPGPARIVSSTTTVVVEPGWLATARLGDLVLARTGDEPADRRGGTDPTSVSVLIHQLMGIAEEMGFVVEQTAASVNIAERRDYSCAVFDAHGNLVANAPHIPVHLGSMSEAVRAVLADHGRDWRAGDLFLINDPARGGTHLPDLTVVAPVAGPGGPIIAVRGHHADIGGITPGSMPAHSTTLAEEGLVVRGEKLGVRFEVDPALALALLARGPARSPEQSLQDLRAQGAACARGANRLTALSARTDLVAGFRAIREAAAAAVRRLRPRLTGGTARCPLDDGGEVVVSVRVGEGRATIDFTGTSPALPTNANAPRAVVRAAVLYVLRVLTEEDVPLNDGCLEPIELIIPRGSLLDPPAGAAVVAGNVETSQLVCDALFLATGTLAGSQGTMNNVAFGDGQRQYYETLAGGSGAGPDGAGGFDGASGTQCHMTNSRLTDPEVLEARLPVRVRRFALRPGSGGEGCWRGGDGLVRELEFTAPMELSLLTGRRLFAPPGLDGGGDGAPGRQWLTRDGVTTPLGHREQLSVRPGDRVTVETPGGGGLGAPERLATRPLDPPAGA